MQEITSFYENISNILNRINQGEDVMCIKSSEYSTNIKFRFIINLDSNYKKVDELDLIPHEIDLLKKYDKILILTFYLFS